MATFTQKSDTKIMELLKTKEIRHYIAQTDLGDLTLMLRKGETKYRLVLDSVPVSDEIHDELMNLLYPSKVEIPQVNKKTYDRVGDIGPLEDMPTHMMHTLNGKTENTPIGEFKGYKIIMKK